MKNKKKIIALIPVRKNSIGFKNKNRKLIEDTLIFLNKFDKIDKIYISSDDDYYAKYINKKIFFIKRKKSLSRSETSIKEVMEDFIASNNISNDVFIWLFYVTIPFKFIKHFEKAYNLINRKKIFSICSFVESYVHPFNTYFLKYKKAHQFIKNNIFRRQDLKTAYMQHHYICIFRASIIKKLNYELFNSNLTYPLIIENNFREKLIEVDSKEDLQNFKLISKSTK